MTTIYVLPTEEGQPPRAMLGEMNEDESQITGELAIFSNDLGTWTLNGLPLPEELAKAISAHAASLGVPGFSE